MQLDTLTISDRLTEAGASPELAREWATLWHESITEGLASKDDLENMELRLKNDIDNSKSELEGKISDIRSDIKVLKWGIGVLFGTLFPSVLAILYILIRTGLVQ